MKRYRLREEMNGIAEAEALHDPTAVVVPARVARKSSGAWRRAQA